MIHYDMPLITGSVENQLKMLKSFLFQQTEKMNYNLDMTTPEKFWQTTVDAIANADNEQEEDVYRSSYTSLKSLIIKSATEVLKTEQTFSHMLEGQYIAKSDFGTYFEKATVNIEGTPYGITQLYNYTAEINTNLSQTMSSTKEDLEQTKTGLSTTNENLNKAKTELSTAISNVSNELSDYKVKTSHYIKEGYLDTTTSNPVFGVEIGLLESVFTYDGKEISNSVPKKIRVTPDRMSFYSGSNEVAYLKETAIYFPNARITGGTLDIGSGTFKVDSNGNMTATSGRIGDWSINSTGGIQYHVGDKTFNEGGYYIFSPHGHGVAHSICGSPSTKDWILSISNTFGVTGAGKLYAKNAVITGEITATSGKIGGWTINGSSIYSDKSNYNVALCNFDNTNDNSRVLYCQNKSDGLYTFRLYRNGELLATNADITGKITATSGSFECSDGTAKTVISNGEAKFYTTVSNSLKQYGLIKAVVDSNTGSTDPMLCFQSNATNSAGISISASKNSWYIMYKTPIKDNDATDKTSHLFYGNAHFKGSTYCTGSVCVGSHVNLYGTGKYLRKMNADGTAVGIIGLSSSGNIAIGQSNFTGRVNVYSADTISLSTDVRLDLSDQFSFYIGVKNVLNLYNSATGYGLDAKSVVFQVLRLSETSDERLKENITALDKRYEEAFSLLSPCNFNFKGHSETSVGFTAQQVQRAFSAANIDADGFVSRIDSDEQGMDGYQFSLSYTRFVALNTHMIQKCLKEIATLKAEIQILKQKG